MSNTEPEKIDGSHLSKEELFGMVKAYLNTQFEVLKSCEDFVTSDSLMALTRITITCKFMYTDEYYGKICSWIVDFMLQQGLAQLLIKMFKSLTKRIHHDAFAIRHLIHLIIGQLAVNVKDKTGENKVCVELVKCGVIQALLQDLDTCNPNTIDPEQRVRIINNLIKLHNLIDTPDVIPIYRTASAVNILAKFTETEHRPWKKGAEYVMTEVYTLHVLACIVNEEESETYLSSSASLKTMIEMLNRVVQSGNESYRFAIEVDGQEIQFGTDAALLAHTIGELSSYDATKEAIVDNGGIAALSAILKPEYSTEANFVAAESLWNLAFNESYLDAILTHLTYTDKAAMQMLKNMQSSDHGPSRRASQGLLNRLGIRAIHDKNPVEQPSAQPHPRDPPPFYQETIATSHVMISYEWGQQEKAKKLKDKLQAQGYTVWLDIDKLGYFTEGDVLASMANGVDKADAILICISRSYKASPHCRGEATYAYDRQKPLIPIIMEEDYEGDGWLTLLIATKKCIRAYSDEVLNQDVPHLIRELKNKGRKQ